MMINDMGQYFGLLSGGCLESDIMQQARRCWVSQRNRIIEYDMREEEDLAWQLGIGCGGMVRILLQPVAAYNDYLHLELLRQHLENNRACEYRQVVDENAAQNHVSLVGSEQMLGLAGQEVFSQVLYPDPHLAVFGGGVDARPVVGIALQLGWQVTLVDPRASYARDGYFDPVVTRVREPIESLTNSLWLQHIDMAIIMTHNIKLDGQSLALVQSSSARYIGLLGPTHRTDRVLNHINTTRAQLVKPLANPVGLRLGGELPESIALSMLAEAHAFIEGRNAKSISGVLVS